MDYVQLYRLFIPQQREFTMRLIAVRLYDIDDQIAVDRLFAKGTSYALIWGAVADEPERVEIMSADRARQWLSECPEQLVQVREAI